MSRNISRMLLGSLVAFFALALVLCALPAWGQMETVGTVSVTVLDQSGAVVRGAQLSLQDIATNDVRNAVTDSGGSFAFPGLPIGTYKLTVTATGFAKQVFDSVIVQGGQVTGVKATLKVGAASEEVVVTASETPLETSSNAITTTIDMKQLEDLPLNGRDIASLAQLSPGFARSTADGGGTWNGLPEVAQGNNVDGVISSTNRMKFGGDTQPEVSVRIEDMQEMTVQTSNLDLNQGYGQSAMQASFVTRRGSNSFHGRVYEDHQNSALNANSWTNDARGQAKNHLILNNFGGAVGGPILKDKLFFFGGLSFWRQPGGFTASNAALTATAASGIFTYRDPPNAGQTVNLLTVASTFPGLSTTIPGMITSEQATVTAAEKFGTLSPDADPNLVDVTWSQNSPDNRYFPTVRLDYNVSQKFRMNFAWNKTYRNDPNVNQTPFPGPPFAGFGASNKFNFYTTALGFDWTITPTMVNQFRGGYFYNFEDFAYDANPNIYLNNPFVNWAISAPGTIGPSGQSFNLGVNNWYPIFNFADNVTWQHGSHSITYGITWWREQDHYSDAPNALESFNLGLAPGDPALSDFNTFFASASSFDRSDAEALYATVVGRISSIGPNGPGYSLNPSTGQFNTGKNVAGIQLNELQKAWGLYLQDSFHVKPTLTMNYGLRWDFTGDDFDRNHQYQSATLIDMYGPSGVGNLFQPGNHPFGNFNPQYISRSHQYNPWNVSPQPTLGLAWNPNYSGGFLGKLLGGNSTVVRASYQLRRFTEPEQYIWNDMSNHGFGYYQNFSLQGVNGGGAGTFTPGSLELQNDVPSTQAILPPFLFTPPTYTPVLPQSIATWINFWGAGGITPNIRQPYTQEWNVGVQRQFGRSNVLEIRYLGSHSLHEWLNQDPNEVNIFENGFLNEFQNAQSNYTINLANGFNGGANCNTTNNCPTFADNGFAGQAALPIFDAAFAGEASGGTGAKFADYNNSNFIIPLTQGNVGSVAGSLAGPFGTVPYICNLVGPKLTPCSRFTFSNPGPYLPVNFFQANPFGAGQEGAGMTNLMTDAGYGNYNGLQMDFRQNNWHGMQFDVNYTWSHSLGQQPDNRWLGASDEFSMRNLRLSYGPTLFDVRHVVHASGTYDLPFGTGKTFLNYSGIADKIVGGWNLGTIVTYQTGSPFEMFGGFNTFNDYGDGGVVLTGVTASQLQNAVGVFHIPGRTFADGINPKYLLGTSGGGNPAFIQPNTTPGTLGSNIWLYGPHFFNTDLAVTKSVPIHENVRFVFQSEFLNAFNHPAWGIRDNNAGGDTNIQGSFGRARIINTSRRIEFRANIEF